jgi:HEAT repeat protein
MKINTLIEAVDNLWGHGKEARKNAVHYLRGTKPSEILPLLRPLLRSNNLERRMSAAEAMLIVDRKSTVDEILFLLDSPEAWIRRHVSGFLLDYGKDNVNAQNKLIQVATSDEDGNVRAMACETLAWIGDERCIEPLRMIAANDLGADSQGTPVKYFAQQAIDEITDRLSGHVAGNDQ